MAKRWLRGKLGVERRGQDAPHMRGSKIAACRGLHTHSTPHSTLPQKGTLGGGKGQNKQEKKKQEKKKHSRHTLVPLMFYRQTHTKKHHARWAP